jgi:23S rRNA pseudouridine1911/1915/1917 synthase
MTIREDGRNAITHYQTEKVITSKKGRKFSLLKIHLETGRTHQIRVHMQSMSCPVVGDLLYSRTGLDYKKYGLMLLAKSISFVHPYTEETVSVEIDFPERFIAFEQNAPLLF